MSLQEEITARASKIYRETYQMSIGELINLYRDGEMDIHPEFQRVFRWSEYQKTKLIESIMLNIPIPSIFVSQNDDGVWDVIDGVQRLSTIFQFVGILKDENGEDLPALTLQKTDYLPSFAGVQWNNEIPELSFTKEQQLFFKRARMDVIIMKKESDPTTKYELFQRLNTGGSLLSDQEVRNCLMIMTNKSFYEFVMRLDSEENFRTVYANAPVDDDLILEYTAMGVPSISFVPYSPYCQYGEHNVTDFDFTVYINYDVLVEGSAMIQAAYGHKTVGLSGINVSISADGTPKFSGGLGVTIKSYYARPVSLT